MNNDAIHQSNEMTTVFVKIFLDLFHLLDLAYEATNLIHKVTFEILKKHPVLGNVRSILVKIVEENLLVLVFEAFLMVS